VHLYPFDAEYLRRLAEGDPPTVDHFVGYFSKLMLIKLRARGASTTAINDVIQETFKRVLAKVRSPEGLDSPKGFGSYVNSVCNNVVHEHHRELARREPLGDDYVDTPTDVPGAEEVLLAGETCARVQRTLKLLKPKEEQILRALFVDEKSKDEVCAEFGIDRGYLRVVLHRAKERFRFLYLNGKG
jgi:RNA polymerase sigma-70 factor (ECF subfamily)